MRMSVRPLRVLNIEDSEEDSELIQLQLRRSGYELEYLRVETGEQMRTALSAQEWDVIISDHSLPHFDGLAALDIFKETEFDIPFIVVSGRVGDELAVRLMKTGAHDFIPKDNLSRLGPSVDRELGEAENRKERSAAREELTRLSHAIKMSSDGISVYDMDGGLLFANRAFERMYGSREEGGYSCMAGILEIMDPQHLKEAVVNLESLDDGGLLKNHECSLERSDGGRLFVEVSASLMTDEVGHPAGFVVITRDVTERKRAEELERQRAKDEIAGILMSALPVFAAGITPQLRDSLTGRFAELFETNMRPRFLSYAEEVLCDKAPSRGAGTEPDLQGYLSWISELFTNFGVQTRTSEDGDSGSLELLSCPWLSGARGNPIFCLLCRAMVVRSFSWTGSRSAASQETSIAGGKRSCRFTFIPKGDGGRLGEGARKHGGVGSEC